MSEAKVNVIPNSVLVIGATGCIGFGVAVAFRKAGYFVYGVIRNPDKQDQLWSNEIIPVLVKTAADVSSYEQHIKESTIIVDCSDVFADEDPSVLPLAIIEKASAASKSRDPIFAKKTFIYTSGIMVYGHDERIRNEEWPIATHFYATWRRKVEEHLISDPNLNGIVIRPGWVFGGNGGHFPRLFVNPEKIVIKGANKQRKYSWIHVDDLARAYVAAAKKSSLVRGEIYNVANNYDNPIWADLKLASAKLAGYKGTVNWESASGWKEELGDANVVIDSTKAMSQLDWSPKIFGFLDNLPFYYSTHIAKTKGGPSK